MKPFALILLIVFSAAYCAALLRIFIHGSRCASADSLILSNPEFDRNNELLFGFILIAFSGKFFAEILEVYSAVFWWPYVLSAAMFGLGVLWGKSFGPLNPWMESGK